MKNDKINFLFKGYLDLDPQKNFKLLGIFSNGGLFFRIFRFFFRSNLQSEVQKIRECIHSLLVAQYSIYSEKMRNKIFKTDFSLKYIEQLTDYLMDLRECFEGKKIYNRDVCFLQGKRFFEDGNYNSFFVNNILLKHYEFTSRIIEPWEIKNCMDENYDEPTENLLNFQFEKVLDYLKSFPPIFVLVPGIEVSLKELKRYLYSSLVNSWEDYLFYPVLANEKVKPNWMIIRYYDDEESPRREERILTLSEIIFLFVVFRLLQKKNIFPEGIYQTSTFFPLGSTSGKSKMFVSIIGDKIEIGDDDDVLRKKKKLTALDPPQC